MSNTATLNTYTVYGPDAVEVPDTERVLAYDAVQAVRLLGFATGAQLDVFERQDVVEVRHPITGALEFQVARIGF